jgi:hypothetical protein
LGSTTGLTIGDFFYLSHGSLTAGVYQIATIPDGTHVTVVGNPLDGTGNQTGIAYQITWSYDATAGTAPTASSSDGQINHFKVRASDSGGNETEVTDTNYVRDAPAGADFVAVDGKSYTGETTNDPAPAFNLLSAWTNRGGVSHVALGAHSIEAVTDFRWGDTTTGEKTLAAALAGGFSLTAGDGQKYGSLKVKSKAGGVIFSVDMDIVLDTAAPTIVMSLVGR